jgi:O-succinylhomoserine sulfhydrylase
MSASTHDRYRPETRLVHSGTLRSQFGETSEALFLTQGYVYDTAAQAEAPLQGRRAGLPIFALSPIRPSRCSSDRMAAFEGAEAARATATGMAAVTLALVGQLKAGDHVVAAKALFGSCRYIVEDYLPRYRRSPRRWSTVPISINGATRCGPTPRRSFLESPTNPTLDVIDIEAVAQIAHAAGATLVVDNVFATPIFQSPLALGADCVVYSATKHIDGQGRCLGGIILASEKFIQSTSTSCCARPARRCRRSTPGCCSRDWRRLPVRVRRQTDSAATLAVVLAEHPKIARLIYPGRPDHPQAAIAQKQMRGGSTLLAFDIKGGKKAAFRFQDALKLIRISNNLGDAKSLITHPATTTHQRLTPAQRAELGISDGLVRVSVGLEHPDDIVEDVLAALEAV